MRTLSPLENRAVGAAKVKIHDVDWHKITKLVSQMRGMKKGYVVYAPVETSEGIATIRVESLGGGRVREEIVQRTKLSTTDFEKYLLTGSQPESAAVRDRLRLEVLPGNPRDKGKTVFFKDLAYFGVSPPVLGRADDVVVASNIPRAAANLKSLHTTTHAKAKYVGVFGFPATETEYTALFGETANIEALGKWRQHRADAEVVANTFDIRLVQAVGDVDAAKQQILRELEQGEGIVFMVAHAEGCKIILPGGKAITITPGDIAELKLRKNPFVVLRVCQTSDRGFADAFIQAGARGVWMNRGIIDAGVATKQVQSFMKQVRMGKTIAEAIRSVRAADAAAAIGTHLVVQEEHNANVEG